MQEKTTIFSQVKNNGFIGSIVALITPMFANRDIDYEALARLVEFHIENGTHGIVAVGTTGESATLSVTEHLEIIEFVVKQASGRIKVIAGIGGNSTREAIHLTQNAENLGADAGLSVVPYYNKPTQEGLYQHFKAIASSCSLPIILYNVPGRTVADLHNETTARLAEIDNIIAIKDATGDMERGKSLIDLCADKIDVLSGDDATTLNLMKLGAKGCISVTSNVAPKQMSEMCEAAVNQNFEQAELLNQSINDLHHQLFLEANPIPVKYAMSKLGYTENVLRLPLTSLTEEYQTTLDQALNSAIDLTAINQSV